MGTHCPRRRFSCQLWQSTVSARPDKKDNREFRTVGIRGGNIGHFQKRDPVNAKTKVLETRRRDKVVNPLRCDSIRLGLHMMS